MTTQRNAVNTPHTPGNLTRAENVPAIERASGRSWQEWLETFEAAGAQTLGPRAVARVAREAMPDLLTNPDWWAQATAIAFEQHAGLRVPGQSSTGTFRVSASRTLPLDRDSTLEVWLKHNGDTSEHLGHEVSQGRGSLADKRSFWRLSLEGAGRVEVAATAGKGPSKTILGVNHESLTDSQSIEQWRAYWKELLAGL